MTKLLSPGPVPIPEFVKIALSKSVIHHRTQEFEAFYRDLIKYLQYLFQTQQGICTCMGSGTYGVEMAIYSLFKKGEEILVPTHGKFSERWADYSRLLGIKVHELPVAWGQSPQKEKILESLNQYPSCRGLVLTHSETSTGAVLDLEEIAFAVKEAFPEVLILVDGITSIGALPYYHDDWKIDCSVIASQKALMNPAGLVGFAFSQLAEARLRETHISDFQNLHNHLTAARKNNSAFTPPVQLLFGLEAALKQIEHETLPRLWNRVHQTATYFRKEIQDMGGTIIPTHPSDSLSAFTFSGISGQELKDKLEQDYGLFLSGGQGEFKGKILRVSHMGMLDRKDMEEVIKSLKETLSTLRS